MASSSEQALPTNSESNQQTRQTQFAQKGNHPYFRDKLAFGDGQLCVTIKKSIPKIIAALNRIADSCMMVELQALIA